MAKRTEKFRAPPARYRLQFRLRADEIKSISANFQQQIAFVPSMSTLRFGQEIIGTSAQDKIDLGALRNLASDTGFVILISSMGIERRCRRVRQAGVRDEAGCASRLVGELDKGCKGLAFRVAADQSIIHLHASSNRRRGCRLVWCRKIIRVVREQCDVWHQIEGEWGISAGCKDSGRGQTTWRKAFTNEEDDPERFLDDPMLEIK